MPTSCGSPDKQASGDDEGRRAQRARDIGLFRYVLIRSAADPGLTTRQRGPLVRALAEAEHVGPFGDRVRVSRVSLDRWIRAWRAGGFDALVPSTRHAEPRMGASVLELAAALKREVPARTAAQVPRSWPSMPARRPRRGPCNDTSPAWS